MRFPDFRQLISVITSKDTESGEDRSFERYRRIIKTAAGSLGSQVVNIISAVIVTPVLLNYIGLERYGLIAALSSALVLMNYLDFGVGIGIQNKVSKAYALNDHESGTIFVSTGMVFYSLVFVSLVLFAIFVIPHVSITRWVKLETHLAQAELLPTVQVVFIGVAFSMFSTFVQRLFDGLQQGYLTRYVAVAARLLGIVLMLVMIHFKAGLPILVLGSMLPNMGIMVAYGLLLRRYPWMRPSLLLVRPRHFLEVARIGLQGIGAIVAVSVLNYGIPFVISNRVGASSSAVFSVASRLFLPILQLVISITTPFWPAVSEAMARGDIEWIRRGFEKYLKLLSAVAVAAILVVTLAGKSVILLWTRNASVVPGFSLLFAVSLFHGFLILNAPLSSVLNGMNRFTGQLVYGSITSGICLALGAVLAGTYGAEGVCWAFNIGASLRIACMFLEVHYALGGRAGGVIGA